MDEASPARSTPVSKSTVGQKRQWFTVERANRSLPLVRRIVTDLTRHFGQLQRLQRQRTALQKAGNAEAAKEVARQGAVTVERVNEMIAELREIGCDIKDLQGGLVDFPGRRNGRGVLLCWKLGEQDVAFWHELHAGFPGRRPVDEACE